jgi:hypothetical protein
MFSESKKEVSIISSAHKKLFYWFVFLFLGTLVAISFWIFSRFTVDDAFITWRYGKNIVDAGVWGYNPTNFDLTQAYTNPIYAALSIISHLLEVDVVLFFKVFSLILVAGFAVWFSKRTGAGIFVILLYSVPATFIHAFSGLETFLYVILVTSLFIFLVEDKFWSVILCCLILFMTRPESWAFLILVPMFYFLPKTLDENPKNLNAKAFLGQILNIRYYNYKSGFLALMLLAVPMSVYFYFHKVHFGYILPNTFYIKSGGQFSPVNFIYFLLAAVPVIGLLITLKIRAFIVALCFFGAVILSYSTSSLAMNYIDRFAFHILVPSYLILIYLAAREFRGHFYLSLDNIFNRFYKVSFSAIAFSFAVIWLSVFGMKNLAPDALVHIANYYPRALDSHAALGKAIKTDSLDYNFNSMSFGDAGMTAYHSGISSLDNIGLGSALVAHSGMSAETISAYTPELIVFHARPYEIRLGDHNQELLYSWGKSYEYEHVCQVFWKPDYTLNIYSKYELNAVKEVCTSSKDLNDIKDKEYFLKNGLMPPWNYWKT